ncbi:MAG: sodium:proton antiporter [Negativicutes bacterium]|jgi:CPA1 family monovalent cation:H+ antiporter
MHNSEVFTYVALMLASFIVGMLGRVLRIPYTIALVVSGLILGSLQLLPGAHLSPELLFAVFLPPLLFEGGINIKIQYLKHKWQLILALALCGTILSMCAIGWSMSLLCGMPIFVALLFGAIISPTDPISVLAIFRKSGMNERLTMVVEAESLFNDGVAVVLFIVVQQIIVQNSFSLFDSTLLFGKNVCGGIAVGLIIGSLVALLMMKTKDHLLCTTLTTIAAYGTYLCAEMISVSGVIAVVVASLVVGNYGISKRLSAGAYTAVMAFWEYAAFAVNSLVFLLIGIEVAKVITTSFWQQLLFGAVVVLFGRAVSVYALSGMFRLFGKEILHSWQHMLVWSGLRGALSMAMVMGVAMDFPYRDILLSYTFAVVLFSLIVQGLTVAPLIKYLKLVKEDSRLPLK